jgi:hypothetical protein
VNRRRFLAASFFSLVIAAVLAVIVYTEHVNASQTVGVWVLTHNVVAGSVYSSNDVERVETRSDSAGSNDEEAGPNAMAARYAQNLSQGDVLRQDDLVPLSAQSEVALTVQDPPPLNSGDRIDVYASLGNQQQALIGRGLIVETVSGGSITVLISAQDEPSWIAIGSSSVPLHVARTVAGARVEAPPMSADDAIHLLCGDACAAPPSVTASGP